MAHLREYCGVRRWMWILKIWFLTGLVVTAICWAGSAVYTKWSSGYWVMRPAPHPQALAMLGKVDVTAVTTYDGKIPLGRFVSDEDGVVDLLLLGLQHRTHVNAECRIGWLLDKRGVDLVLPDEFDEDLGKRLLDLVVAQGDLALSEAAMGGRRARLVGMLYEGYDIEAQPVMVLALRDEMSARGRQNYYEFTISPAESDGARRILKRTTYRVSTERGNRNMWAPLAVISMILANVVITIPVLVVAVVQGIRDEIRYSRGKCPRCKYPLPSRRSGVCPECGLIVGPPPPAAPPMSEAPPLA